MGFIDSNDFTVTCEKCGATENTRVVQRGSSFGAHWSDPPALLKFESVWDSEARFGPQLTSAKCRKCGIDAKVDEK